MNKYTTDSIRNVCLMAHGGAGKTSFAEAMLFNSGASDRLGKILDGTTVLDYDPEEIKRKISINTSVAFFEWKNTKINVIDTPGYFDFAGEVYEGVRAADAAIILASGRTGVSVGTEKGFAYAEEQGMPVIFFVNKMEHENANYSKTLDDLKSHFGSGVAPFQFPFKEGDKLQGYVDVINLKAYKYTPDGKTQETDIPGDLGDEISAVRDILFEAIAETDEALMEKYFAGEEFTREEILGAIKEGVKSRSLFPVYCGAASHNLGITPVMDAIAEYFPSPAEKTVKAASPGEGEEVELKGDASAPTAALIFKTIADPFVGKMSIFRVYSGKVGADSTLFNSSKGTAEKLGKVYVLRGKKQIEVSEVCAGDIGVAVKLAKAATGDTLCQQSSPVILDAINFPKPVLSLAIVPKAKGDEEKISSGLRKLEEEDPTFKVSNNTETRQMLISGLGEQHLDVIVSKLKAKFGVSVDLVEPKVPYREAIRKKVKVEGKHKKQSGGHGQFGHVWIEFEPGESEDLTFAENIFGGAVPKNFFPAVEKGLRECILRGVLAGYPVVNLKATLVDGSYHPVDSSEMAFKIAASIAYKEGLKQANPVLLEPVGKLEVTVPESYMGDIIGDVNKRRGRILGMNPIGKGLGLVEAEVPMSETFKYATDLRSITQGRGSFTLEFVRYEEAPANVAQAIIERAKAEQTEE